MRFVTLGELASVIFVGRALSRIKTSPDAPGTPLVSARDVDTVLSPIEALDRVPASPGRDIDSARLEAGDIVVTARGPLRAAVAESQHVGAIAGANLVVVRLEPGPLPHVLAAYLRHPAVQHQLQATTRGTATMGLGVGDLKSLPLTIPDSHELETLGDAVALTDRYAAVLLNAMDLRRQVALELVHRALTPEKSPQ